MNFNYEKIVADKINDLYRWLNQFNSSYECRYEIRDFVWAIEDIPSWEENLFWDCYQSLFDQINWNDDLLWKNFRRLFNRLDEDDD